jgi:Fe-S-cluster containining protein
VQEWFCKRCGSCCKHQNIPMELYRDEIKLFPKGKFIPHIGYGDSKSNVTVILYKLIGMRCPLYNDDVGCTIYEDRPTICRRFPFRSVNGNSNHIGCDTGCKNAPQGQQLKIFPAEDIEAIRSIIKEVEDQTAYIVGKYYTSKLWLYKNFKWRMLTQQKVERLYGIKCNNK